MYHLFSGKFHSPQSTTAHSASATRVYWHSHWISDFPRFKDMMACSSYYCFILDGHWDGRTGSIYTYEQLWSSRQVGPAYSASRILLGEKASMSFMMINHHTLAISSAHMFSSQNSEACLFDLCSAHNTISAVPANVTGLAMTPSIVFDVYNVCVLMQYSWSRSTRGKFCNFLPLSVFQQGRACILNLWNSRPLTLDYKLYHW